MKFIPRKLRLALAGLVASLSIGPSVALATTTAPVQKSTHDPGLLVATATAPADISKSTVDLKTAMPPCQNTLIGEFCALRHGTAIKTTDPAMFAAQVANASTSRVTVNGQRVTDNHPIGVISKVHHGTAIAETNVASQSGSPNMIIGTAAPPGQNNTGTFVATVENTAQSAQAG